MNNKLKYSSVITVFVLVIIFHSCANQQPPSGGEVDKSPPKLEIIEPPDGTINFKGKSISIKFDEYVDRRSFRDALFISPKPKGELTYNWSGKEVEVSFSQNLEQNRTYVFTIGKSLRDVKAGNELTSPISFAISTGDIIEKGEISGKIYDYSFTTGQNEIYKDLFLAAYKFKKEDINPEKDEPDFITQSDNAGNYKFTNLPMGLFRVFCINDFDKNFLFDKGFDDIGVTNQDILIGDSTKISKVDFLMNLVPSYFTKYELPFLDAEKKKVSISQSIFNKYIAGLISDSTGFIYSSFKNNDVNVSVFPKIFLYFKNSPFTGFEIIDNISLTDTNKSIKYPLSFQWVNDSILELSPASKLPYSQFVSLNADFTKTKRNTGMSVKFQTIDERKSALVKADISNIDSISSTYLFFLNAEQPYQYRYLKADWGLQELNITTPEGKYWVFTFTDLNGDGFLNMGNYYPFVPCEKFYFFTEPLTFKFLWDNKLTIKH